MVACVTTADTYLEESLNTLKICKTTPHDMQNRPNVENSSFVCLAGFVGWQQQNTDGGVCHYC